MARGDVLCSSCSGSGLGLVKLGEGTDLKAACRPENPFQGVRQLANVLMAHPHTRGDAMLPLQL